MESLEADDLRIKGPPSSQRQKLHAKAPAAPPPPPPPPLPPQSAPGNNNERPVDEANDTARQRKPRINRRRPQNSPPQTDAHTQVNPNDRANQTNTAPVPKAKPRFHPKRRPKNDLQEGKTANPPDAGDPPKSARNDKIANRNPQGPPRRKVGAAHAVEQEKTPRRPKAKAREKNHAKQTAATADIVVPRERTHQPPKLEFDAELERKILASLYSMVEPEVNSSLNSMTKEGVQPHLHMSLILYPTDPELPAGLFAKGLRMLLKASSPYDATGIWRNTCTLSITDDEVDKFVCDQIRAYWEKYIQGLTLQSSARPLYTFLKNLDQALLSLLYAAAAEKARVEAYRNGPWAEEEQKLLEDGLVWYRQFKDPKVKWKRISEMVKTRSPKQCLEHFKECAASVRAELQRPADQPSSQGKTMVTENEADTHNPGDKSERQSDDEGQLEILQGVVPSVGCGLEKNEGQRIVLSHMELRGAGVCYMSKLSALLNCGKCGKKIPLSASPAKPNQSNRPHEGEMECSNCHVHIRYQCLGTWAHTSAPTVCQVIIWGGSLFSIDPSDFMAVCLKCNSNVAFFALGPAQRKDLACRHCHAKLALSYASVFFEGNQPTHTAKEAGLPERKPRRQANKEQFRVGQPLPDNGTCSHYKKSFRWFRFPCCARAFPCDACHDKESDHKANEWATRVICGYCSREQSATNKDCVCGNAFQAKRTAHWEGGKGCRDPTAMARNDSRKYHLLNKQIRERKANAAH